MGKVSEIFATSVIFATWIILIYSMFVDYTAGVHWRVSIWVALFVLSTGLYFFMKHHSIWTNFMIVIMILSAILGELYLELYYSIPIYDKILHFVVPIMIVFVSYDSLSRYIPKKKKRLKWAMGITLAIVLFWEVAEIVFDYFFDAPLVGVFVTKPLEGAIANRIEILSPAMDTFYDVLLDIIGILVAGLTLKRFYLDKKRTTKKLKIK